MLVDTDVLIWHLRGYPKATQRLDQLTLLTPPQDFDYFCVNFHANKGCKTQ